MIPDVRGAHLGHPFLLTTLKSPPFERRDQVLLFAIYFFPLMILPRSSPVQDRRRSGSLAVKPDASTPQGSGMSTRNCRASSAGALPNGTPSSKITIKYSARIECLQNG